MAELYENAGGPISLYRDRRYAGGADEREQKLKLSTTLYVGNLSFYTNEEQVFALFSRAGEVRRIIMGLDRIKKTPCGFCFVEYFTRGAAEASVRFLSGSKLDGRVIRVDYDTGFEQGRQYGRGRSGGQVRDEYRTEYDAGRGGRGRRVMTGEQLWGDDAPDAYHQRRDNRPRRGRGRGRRYSGPPSHYGGGGGGYDGGRRPKRRRSDDDYRGEPHAKAPRYDLPIDQRIDMPLGSGNGGWHGKRLPPSHLGAPSPSTPRDAPDEGRARMYEGETRKEVGEQNGDGGGGGEQAD